MMRVYTSLVAKCAIELALKSLRHEQGGRLTYVIHFEEPPRDRRSSVFLLVCYV